MGLRPSFQPQPAQHTNAPSSAIASSTNKFKNTGQLSRDTSTCFVSQPAFEICSTPAQSRFNSARQGSVLVFSNGVTLKALCLTHSSMSWQTGSSPWPLAHSLRRLSSSNGLLWTMRLAELRHTEGLRRQNPPFVSLQH